MEVLDIRANLTDKGKGINNLDLTPPAQSPEVLRLKSFCDKEDAKIKSWIEGNRYEAKELKAIIALMWQYGLRVGEVLRIKETDILTTNQIRIRGEKGSEDRFVTPLYFVDVWFSRKSRMPVFLRNISRFYLYRICKRYGFYYEVLGKGNNKVTHYFRYLYFAKLKLNNLTEKERAKAVGHKNVKSQNYYYDKNLKSI